MKRIKLLTIDDDPYICEIIRLYAEKEGYEVLIAHDGMTGLALALDLEADLIVLDIMLPEIEGWEVCRRLKMDRNIPVIMLTGKGERYDKMTGFELGADDYVVKPFDSQELMARIKAVLRRSYPALCHDEVAAVSGLKLDLRRYAVETENAAFTLPPKEMELLYFLVSHANRVFTRQQLLDQVWGYDYEGDPRTVDVHIKRIRERLVQPDQPWSIQTIRGVGYKLEAGTR
ncbi:DNA-binding response regulator [Xylanibacillus composti]|uniref:DNA-binding response regulator n=1 Tax=Xylanibacillus composti TaxID=1572762 RepID=A0A8J4M300_9BACL|nr:response regulator transcription factor [Xylanibacillus composti]GIQ69590.1 DNA-binding response regulator [Xylanibacillus composti]